MANYAENILKAMGRTRNKVLVTRTRWNRHTRSLGQTARALPNTTQEYNNGIVTVFLYSTPIVVASADWIEFWPGNYQTATTVKRMNQIFRIATGYRVQAGTGTTTRSGTYGRGAYFFRRESAKYGEYAVISFTRDEPSGLVRYWALDRDHKLRLHSDGAIDGTPLWELYPRLHCKYAGIGKYTHPREWMQAWRVDPDSDQGRKIMAAALRRRIKG